MLELASLQPVEYLLVGHVAVDLTPAGKQLGGTVSYAALTARALGLRVGIVTSAGGDAPLRLLEGIQIFNVPTEHSTVFENIKTENGRRQILHHRAAPISFEHVPPVWRDAPIVHLAPIAQEVDPAMAKQFDASWVGVTPQGWLRGWDEKGSVFAKAWENSEQVPRSSGRRGDQPRRREPRPGGRRMDGASHPSALSHGRGSGRGAALARRPAALPSHPC
ncbi:MAG: hypothetical protein HND47_15785 [Chloroflexi bacterium]|nr:hypothetical protein [Chloroflexota bacterium]